jgi:cellulose 1,4-beta-cellobiosidase
MTGFITNVANYSALQSRTGSRPPLSAARASGSPRGWTWNQYTDKLSFAQAFRQKLVSIGFNSNIRMPIDTYRNG